MSNVVELKKQPPEVVRLDLVIPPGCPADVKDKVDRAAIRLAQTTTAMQDIGQLRAIASLNEQIADAVIKICSPVYQELLFGQGK